MARRLAVHFAHAAGMGDLLFTLDGKQMVTCGSDARICVVDPRASEATVQATVEESSAVTSVAVSNDATMAACGTEKDVRLFDMPGWANGKTVYRPSLPVNHVEFSRTGLYLCARSRAGRRSRKSRRLTNFVLAPAPGSPRPATTSWCS